MINRKFRYHSLLQWRLLVSFSLLFLISCNDDYVHIGEKEIVAKPEEINLKAEDVIRGTLRDVLENHKNISDSVALKNAGYVHNLYQENSFQPLWSAAGKFSPAGDSLFLLIDSSYEYGLFPEDYYKPQLMQLRRQLVTDTSRMNKLDAAKWAYSDLLLTSAFVQVIKDLSKGRLLADSILSNDSLLTPAFFSEQLQAFNKNTLPEFTASLEPNVRGYKNLKAALLNFLEDADLRKYSMVKTKDSAMLPLLVYQRLAEEDTSIIIGGQPADSITIAKTIKKFQKAKGLKANGKVSTALIDILNNTDREKFIRIAITLDRFKMLPALPAQYIWVNIPSYYLQVIDSDTVVLTSRIVVGKPETKTPVITSAITDMITYPKWHIPQSIINKDILPGLKKDPGYTVRKGYTLFDEKGVEVNPYSVSWAKFSKSIPYNVVQGSGDENALGILKFNFPNKYSVYLHDTNQRYLFSKKNRALSHGCVRVQGWQELAHYILRNDSIYSERAIPVDSVNNWLAAKEKHVVPVRKKLPLFIRYFSCDAREDKVVFYEDIYGEDRKLRNNFFSSK